MLSVDQILELVHRYMPRRALARAILFGSRWGPAHELAHALIALPYERRQKRFGLDKKGVDPTYALTCEAAAMRISFRLHRACGDPRLVNDELRATDEESICLLYARATTALLRERGCLGVPRTAGALERLCRARGLRPHRDKIDRAFFWF